VTLLSNEQSAQFLLKLDKFFNIYKRVNTIEAMPFPVSASEKNLRKDCQFIRVKNVDTFNIFHCIQEELVEKYIVTNNNLSNCIDCPFYKKED
jgi:hypothetical protein